MWRKILLQGLGSMVLAGSIVLTACQPAPTPTAAPPSVTQAAPAASQAAAATAPVAPSGLPSVPRNRTLILAGTGVAGKWTDFDIWNPYAIGTRIGEGMTELYEPLAYYSAFADKEYMWLAESYQYSPDYKQLTIKTRSGITWSDGVPFSAEDVAYTLTTLNSIGSKVMWGSNVQQFVDTATAVDPNTVVIKFKIPAPRFWFWMEYKYDIGLYIVPEHIFQGQDWTTFKNFDIAKGWPVSTAPWKVVYGDSGEKIIDRTGKWWAVDQSLVSHLPAEERLIVIPYLGETQDAQLELSHQLDSVRDLVNTAKSLTQQDPALQTYTGNQPPYGYIDWWPLSLFLNDSVYPYNNPDVRWAISYYIDRNQLIQVAFGGNNTLSPLPIPNFPSLKPYFDSVSDLLQQYPTNEYNPAKGDALLTKNGWKKDSQGFWVDAQGKRMTMDILGFDFIGTVAPVVAQQLKNHGIDATFSMPPDVFDRFTKGDYVAATFGHGGSIKDPYDTLNLYQSTSQAIPGWGQVNFSHWTNADFDRITDQVFLTPMDNTQQLTKLWHDAMAIWLPQLPDVQLTQYYQNYVHDTTYWKGWPTASNSYVEEHNAALTWPLVLMQLEPTQ